MPSSLESTPSSKTRSAAGIAVPAQATSASELLALPCAHFSGACAYAIFRHRLRKALGGPTTARVLPRIILVSRRTAKTRRVEGESALASSLRDLLPRNAEVNLVDLASMPILAQARTVMAADVLAGVHGAGLTHMLFLPVWGSVVEVALQAGWRDEYGDHGSPPMYADMAQQLGLGFVSWLYDQPLEKGEVTLRLSPRVMAALVGRALELR